MKNDNKVLFEWLKKMMKNEVRRDEILAAVYLLKRRGGRIE